MARTFSLVFLASLALCQAVPESAVLDETYADVVELPSQKREDGERHYKLKAFGQEIDLNLHRTRDLLPTNLPVYVYGEDSEGNPTVDDWTHNTDTFQRFYTDRKAGASLMIEDIDGETKLSGMIAEDLLIEPVTDIIIPEDDSTDKREITRLRHIVYRVKKPVEKTTVDDYELVEEAPEEDSSEKRATPSRIYATVQVVVDYSLWKKLARSESQVITYLKIYYNSVNMLYSPITSPSVSVSIHGITICKTASACSMVENSRLGSDGVNAKSSLTAIAKYAYSVRGTTGTNYAMMIVMTDYDMCSPQSSGTCDRSTAGLAYVGTVCGAYSSFSSKTSKTGLTEDHGAYDGIKTVAHEMGHILGMNHDGDGPASSGAPGARSCPWSGNYIMGKTEFVPNQFIWSSCSVNQLRWMVAQSKASCLQQKPGTTRYPLINKLPGKEVSLDNQCKVLYGASSSIGCRLPGVNSGNDQLCLGLMCKTSSRGCSSKTPPAEGSYCGPQRHCQRGKCVCDPSAPLPTAPSRDPSCVSDTSGIRINGQSCVNLLTSSNGLSHCDSDLVKQYCCVSRVRYCKATPISCDGNPIATPKPFTIGQQWTTPKFSSPSSVDGCGRSCTDTPNIRINQMSCSTLLSSSSLKTQYCDNPTTIQHCCQTRERVCSGYHSITRSCDDSCQDNPRMSINGKKCVDFLKTATDRRNYCNASITKQHCCATQRAVCSNSVIG